MAGALAHSGYDVPQAIQGNATNPSGFFEPRWVVNFHKKLLRSAGVSTLDTDPTALDRIQKATDDRSVRDELRSWLVERLQEHDRLVIKDPRMVWFRDLWVSTAQDLGVDPAFVIMLRHPSEVSSSRSQYYNSREVIGVAGWINVALMSEALTHGSPRALVQYAELTADWRPELGRVRDQLDLLLDPAPEERPHPIDEFIDPALRRMKPGWEDRAVPAFLQTLGDRTYDALTTLGKDGDSAETAEALDHLREEYAVLHADALALVNSSVKRMRAETTRKTVRRMKAKARRRDAADAADAADSTPPAGGLRRTIGNRLRRGSDR